MNDVERANRGGASGWGAALAGAAGGAVATVALAVLAVQGGWADKLVRKTMVENPTILVDTADALRDSQYAPVLSANRAALETPFASSWQGAEAKDADVTLVEFYDYACGYCKASLPVIAQLVKEDPKLRVVYREFPILGPDSEAAARMALAASKAGKFMAFHDALYEAGRPSEATLAKAAGAAGVPAAIPSSAEIDGELRKNFQLAQQLGATGTPLFIVGDKVLNGAVGYEALKKAIADARAKKA